MDGPARASTSAIRSAATTGRALRPRVPQRAGGERDVIVGARFDRSTGYSGDGDTVP